MIGAINDTTIAMIAINPMNIVVILAQRGKPTFLICFEKVNICKEKSTN